MEEVFYDPALVTPAWVEATLGLVTRRGTVRRVLGFARAARRHNLEACLPQIRVPTLIVWGRDDRVTPPEVAARFHALLPDSQLRTLARCGHAPMLEQPDAFNAIVREWLEETAWRRAQLTVVSGAPR
jgi:pimeloyl-ACP methyl ester carboxylesterase